MREVPIDVPPPIYRHVEPDGALPALAAHAPFRAVIVADIPVTPAQQNRISDWLVAEGCLYAMAWGVAASSWDDAMDWSCLAKFDCGDVPAHASVLTTWHDNEPLSDVFDFAIRCASHPVEPVDELFVIHVASNENADPIETAFRVALTYKY